MDYCLKPLLKILNLTTHSLKWLIQNLETTSWKLILMLKFENNTFLCAEKTKICDPLARVYSY